MSGLIATIVAFIVASLAVFGLVPHQEPQPIPQPQQQTTNSTPDSNQPVLRVLNAQDYPKKVTVAYQNMPSSARSLFLCIPTGVCTEWGVEFSPKTQNGTFVMTDVPGSTKHIGAGTFTVHAVDFSVGKVYAVSEPFIVTASKLSDIPVPARFEQGKAEVVYESEQWVKKGRETIIIPPNGTVTFTGWALRSAETGASYTIGSVTSLGSSTRRNIILKADEEGALFVHTARIQQDYGAEGGEYHVFLGDQSIWNRDHDTIQLLSPDGQVTDAHTY